MIWSQHIGFKLDLRQAKAWILPEPLHLDFCCCFGSVRPLDNPINGSGQESEADIFAQFFTRIQVKCMQEPWTLALPCDEGSYLQLFIFVSKYMKSLFLCRHAIHLVTDFKHHQKVKIKLFLWGSFMITPLDTSCFKVTFKKSILVHQ